MKRLPALLVLLTSLHVLGQAPVIRAHIEPSNNIMVGQPVRFVVSVFVPNYFTGSPEFPEFDIENAIVVLPQDRPENSNTQIGGATYFGITKTYIIYPQQAGDFDVPSAKLSVSYAIAPPKSTTAEAALPALSFHADIPAAARNLPYFLPTTRLTMSERWSHPLKNLRTGDTVERTITVTAARMQAMLIPPLQLEGPVGVHIYSGEPTVRDQKTSRGDFIYGQRIQTAKYFIQKPGDYTLPPIELKWWNLATHRIATSTLPAITFHVAPNPDFVAELPPPPEATIPVSPQKHNSWAQRRKLVVNILKITLLLVILFLFQKLFRKLWTPLAAAWASHRNPEKHLYTELMRAAKRNNAEATYSNLLRWTTRAFPEASLDDVISLYADTSLKDELSTLTGVLFSSSNIAPTSSSWRGDRLVRCLRRFRNAYLNRIQSGHLKSALKDLNPTI